MTLLCIVNGHAILMCTHFTGGGLPIQLRATCLRTHDAPALSRFYATIFQHDPEIDGGVDYQFGPEQLTVFQLAEPAGEITRSAALIYAVDDVDAVYTRLQQAGFLLDHAPTDKPWGVRSFMIRDPQENTISFVQPLSSP